MAAVWVRVWERRKGSVGGWWLATTNRVEASGPGITKRPGEALGKARGRGGKRMKRPACLYRWSALAAIGAYSAPINKT